MSCIARILSASSPELPSLQKLILTGKTIEGEVLEVKEVLPADNKQKHVWEKYIKEITYRWYVSVVNSCFDCIDANLFCNHLILAVGQGHLHLIYRTLLKLYGAKKAIHMPSVQRTLVFICNVKVLSKMFLADLLSLFQLSHQ